MPSSVNSEFFFDAFKLVLYITCAYLALNIYSRRVQTRWLLALTARRHIVLTLLTLLVVGIKIFEDVISKESGPIDTAVLWFIRDNIPRGLTAFFALITLTALLVVQCYRDLTATVPGWYAHSTLVWLVVMALGTLVYWRETRALARRGGDLTSITRVLPPE